MQHFKQLSDNELNAELNRYNDIIKPLTKPIEEYDNLFDEFQDNSKSLIKTYSKIYNLCKHISFNKITQDETFLGFKYTEHTLVDLVCSESIMNEISHLNKECGKYIRKIWENPIVVENMAILHETTTGVRYIMGLGEENFQVIVKSGVDNFPGLQDALNMKNKTDDNAYTVNKGSDFVSSLKRKREGCEQILILTKEGTRIVYTKKMELFVRRKRQVELILRARKKEEKKTENVGTVYLLSNPAYKNPSLYKIGSTYRLIEERIEELNSETGVAYPFELEYKIKIKDAEYYEKSIHKLLTKYRVKKNKEYFELELDKIKDCLQQVSILSEKGQKKVALANLKKKIKIK